MTERPRKTEGQGLGGSGEEGCEGWGCPQARLGVLWWNPGSATVLSCSLGARYLLERQGQPQLPPCSAPPAQTPSHLFVTSSPFFSSCGQGSSEYGDRQSHPEAGNKVWSREALWPPAHEKNDGKKAQKAGESLDSIKLNFKGNV